MVAHIRRVRGSRSPWMRSRAVELHGRVRTVALRSQETEDGDDHYPVVVDRDWSPPDIPPGMTVRVHFPDE